MSLKNKLSRMKGHMGLEQDKAPTGLEKSTQPRPDIPYLDKWETLSAKPYWFEEEYIFIRVKEYPLDYQHGKYKFQELYDVVEEWNRRASVHPLSAKERKVEDLLFFDTETTGLSHGAGNSIFLLGCCRIQDGKLIVKQFFMPGPGAEVAFYYAFLNDTNDLKNLVTYNGKAFDWPQVKTRHTLIRDAVPMLPAFGHFDLLHGARRLWKDSLESCRLSNVEESILGTQRKEDVPGYLAPMLYFDFLREPDPEIIEGVLIHNEEDMLSLVSLYIHISHMLLGRESAVSSAKEMFELGRWYEYVGEDDLAISFYEKGLGGTSDQDHKLKMALAAIYKKQGEFERAVELWKSLEDSSVIGKTDLFTEMAKVYERHYKEYDIALDYALKAYDNWKQQTRLSDKKSIREKDALIKRIERLERKCKSKEI